MTAEVHQFPSDVERLAAIAKEINAELASATHSALESAIRIGERLLEAKKIAGHGKFLPWLKDNFHATRKQASLYMNAARGADKLRANVTSDVTFNLDTIPAILALPDGPDDDEDTPKAPPAKPPSRRPTVKLKHALDVYDQRVATGQPVSQKDLRQAAGVGASVVDKVYTIKTAEAAVAAAEAAKPEQPLPELPMSAQQKLDAWQKRLEATFEARVDQAARLCSQKWLNDVRLPMYEEKVDKLIRMLEWPSFAVMTREEYRKIVMCLHPDGLKARTEEQLAEAFRIFTSYELKMASNPEKRREGVEELPKTREELLARKGRGKGGH